MARVGEKPLLASTSSATSSPSARRIAGMISSVRPGHSSTSWPHSAPIAELERVEAVLVAQRDEALGLLLAA